MVVFFFKIYFWTRISCSKLNLYSYFLWVQIRWSLIFWFCCKENWLFCIFWLHSFHSHKYTNTRTQRKRHITPNFFQTESNNCSREHSIVSLANWNYKHLIDWKICTRLLKTLFLYPFLTCITSETTWQTNSISLTKQTYKIQHGISYSLKKHKFPFNLCSFRWFSLNRRSLESLYFACCEYFVYLVFVLISILYCLQSIQSVANYVSNQIGGQLRV